MFRDLLVKAEMKKEESDKRVLRREEINKLFYKLAKNVEMDLKQIFKTVKIDDKGKIICSNSPEAYEHDVYSYICKPELYTTFSQIKSGKGGEGYGYTPYNKIPINENMTNTQLTLLYTNAIRCMVSYALKLKQ